MNKITAAHFHQYVNEIADHLYQKGEITKKTHDALRDPKGTHEFRTFLKELPVLGKGTHLFIKDEIITLLILFDKQKSKLLV